MFGVVKEVVDVAVVLFVVELIVELEPAVELNCVVLDFGVVLEPASVVVAAEDVGCGVVVDG